MGKRCNLNTTSFGLVEDAKLATLFREQQLLNLLINKFFRSILVSFHHAGCQFIVVPLICFAIRFNDILSEDGFVGYLVIGGAIVIVLCILWCQSEICG